MASGRLNHGRRSAYDAGCRCEPCKEARREAYRRLEGGPRPHRWREMVWQAWFLDWQTWWEKREAECNGWKTEEEEFEKYNPQPQYKHYLEGMKYERR